MDSFRRRLVLGRVVARVVARVVGPVVARLVGPVLLLAGLAPTACTTTLQTPPQLADCIADGSTACSVNPPSGGIELPVDGGSVDDSGEIISESLDGASCGNADTLVAGDCASCLDQNCCMSDSLCDVGCQSLLACAAENLTCPAVSPSSQTNYDDLLQCAGLYCPAQCLTVVSHDI